MNFGQIEIDWEAAPPVVTLAVRDERGAEFAAVLCTLADLTPPAASGPAVEP